MKRFISVAKIVFPQFSLFTMVSALPVFPVTISIDRVFFLSPAYEARGMVLFSVCLFTGRGRVSQFCDARSLLGEYLVSGPRSLGGGGGGCTPVSGNRSFPGGTPVSGSRILKFTTQASKLKSHFLISFDGTCWCFITATEIWLAPGGNFLLCTNMFISLVVQVWRIILTWIFSYSPEINTTHKHRSNVKKWSSETKQIGTSVAMIDISAAVG